MLYCAMIKEFADSITEQFYETGKSKKVPSTIYKVALRKLDYLNAVHILEDLRVPPGNMLEALKGSLQELMGTGYFYNHFTQLKTH